MAGILVHEWLAVRGGSENVFEVLSQTFPDAERWCLWNASDGRFEDVNETILARTPLRGKKALSVPLMPFAWRALPKREAEWVLTSSHAFAHHAKFRGPAAAAPKLVYAHTPARYVWVPEADGRGDSLAARALSSMLKPLDRARAGEAAAIAANSSYVADRIAATWQRHADVIYPPVDVERFAEEPTLSDFDRRTLDSLPERFILGASRFVPYKRLEEAIYAGIAADLPVVLAGGGPEEARLRVIAADARIPVAFVLDPSQELLAALYSRASVLVFAAVEDFGIMPVEAMAAGTPVIVSSDGGAGESVVDGLTGIHMDVWERTAMASAVEQAVAMDSAACRARAREFSVEAFQTKMQRWVRQTVEGEIR